MHSWDASLRLLCRSLAGVDHRHCSLQSRTLQCSVAGLMLRTNRFATHAPEVLTVIKKLLLRQSCSIASSS